VVDSAETEIGETVEDEREQTPFECLRVKDLYACIAGSLHLLTEREHKIVNARFGLDGAEAKTLEEVGQELGVTRERVRQIQNVALEKLRDAISSREVPARMPLEAAA
jgi:RNA polymerase primary sigma factor